MESGIERQFDTRKLKQLCPKMASEDRIMIIDYRTWHLMKENYAVKNCLRN
jgi:hypothetical protein